MKKNEIHDLIKVLWNENFFADWKMVEDVRRELGGRRYTYGAKELRKALSAADFLTEKKEGRHYMYRERRPPEKLVFKPDTRTLFSWLEGAHRLCLTDYRVIGDYVRYEQPARNILNDIKSSVFASLYATSRRYDTYLLWARPGTGKTSFIEEIMTHLPRPVKTVSIDLTKERKETFEAKLKSLEAERQSFVCFVDEIDSHEDTPWQYDLLKGALKQSERAMRKIFIMVGSGKESLEGMVNYIESESCPKGADVLSRTSENRMTIPELTGGDKILIALSVITRARRGKLIEIDSVEKSALYFIGIAPRLEKAGSRETAEFIARAVERVPEWEDRFKYDDLFDTVEENLTEKAKLTTADKAALENLSKRFVRVSA